MNYASLNKDFIRTCCQPHPLTVAFKFDGGQNELPQAFRCVRENELFNPLSNPVQQNARGPSGYLKTRRHIPYIET